MTFPSLQACILSNASCSPEIMWLTKIKVIVVLVVLADHKGQLWKHLHKKSQTTISLDFACTLHVYTINSICIRVQLYCYFQEYRAHMYCISDLTHYHLLTGNGLCLCSFFANIKFSWGACKLHRDTLVESSSTRPTQTCRIHRY